MSDRNDYKAVMYIRDTASKNSKQSRSVGSQKQAIRQYASKHHYDIVGEYIDSGQSGSTLDRPALNQLRMDIKDKLFDCVVTHAPVRIARRYNLQAIIENELQSANILLIYLNPPSIDSNAGRLLNFVAQEVITKKLLTQK